VYAQRRHGVPERGILHRKHDTLHGTRPTRPNNNNNNNNNNKNNNNTNKNYIIIIITTTTTNNMNNVKACPGP